MKVFISGGCKNGKSSIAEDLCIKLSNGGPLYYIATMIPFDNEDNERIKRHQNSRKDKGFITLEQGTEIEKVLEKSDFENGTYILDSITALMINELYSLKSEMSEESYEIISDKNAKYRVENGLKKLLSSSKNIVFVSDFIYSEIDNYSDYTKEYLEALSYIDKMLAKECDIVLEIVLGNINVIKGKEII